MPLKLFVIALPGWLTKLRMFRDGIGKNYNRLYRYWLALNPGAVISATMGQANQGWGLSETPSIVVVNLTFYNPHFTTGRFQLVNRKSKRLCIP
jgi:hypothetical protein